MSDKQGKKSHGSRNPFRDGGGSKNGPNKLDAGECAIYKAEAKEIIKRFLQSGNMHITLDVMSREQRKVMHEVAQHNGLSTRSTGKEPNRCIILSYRENRLTRSSLVTTQPIIPSPECLSHLNEFVKANPITEDDMNRFFDQKNAKEFQPKTGSSRNKTGIPPVSACPKDLKKIRDKLPASKYKTKVLKSIDDNEVVIISGGTGCGKTTQVPQFILDDAAEKKKKVRIMVTQPRRLAAISISERVAKERGESLGHIVGYKIRLESRSSEKTLLTYCTTGVLLRMLTSDPIASGITHIIMDEIHEREINTDYLLIALRECLKHRKDLKVILMSATIEGNMQLFSSYFQNQSVDVLRIESRTFDVKTFYIDQILAMSGYQPPEHQVFFSGVEFKTEEWEEEIKEIQKEDKRSNNSETKNGSVATNTQIKKTSGSNTCAEGVVNQQRGINSVTTAVGNKWSSGQYTCSDGEIIDEKTMGLFFKSTGCPKIPALTVEFLPDSRDSVYVNGVRYNTDKTQSQVLLEKQKLDRNSMPEYPVMYRLDETHSTSRLAIPEPTTLCSESVQITQELFADASPTSIEKTNTPSTASSGLAKFSTDDFGKFGEKQRISQMLEQRFRSELKSVIPQRTSHYDTDMDKLVERIDFAKLRFAEKYDMFYGTDFENSIDHHLLDHVIQYLADSPVFGTILVFLPGFDDIQLMMGKIDKWKLGLKNMKHVSVIPLHSQMHSINHSDVFKPVTSDIRKIILATNIAEASITIEDVIFVVDTGKVKEKSYNHEAKLSTLSVKPIARSNAEQRSGRAGRVRNGYCIRLYSEAKFNSMPETQMAEMKRAAIYDVTLHAKIFAPNCMRISEFLALAPEPPEEKSIIQSMAFLEQLGAFYRPNNDSGQNEDENENEETTEEVDPELTDLGRLMARLPLDPQLSRMLLFGLSLKCLAPIVNLVALLASREPYVLAQSDERERQSKMKFEMAEQDFSDHLMYIRLCTAFCSKVTYKEQNDFCREHLLNLATMKMVQGTRHQLLQELVRAKVIVAPEKDIMMLLSDSNYNAHSNSWTMVQAAIAAGCYPSIGVSSADSNLKKVQTFNDQKAGLHPSSILKKQIMKLNKQVFSGPRLEYVVFQEMCLMTSDQSLSMKTVTAIPALTALIFTGPIRISQQAVEEHRILFREGEDEAPLEEEKLTFGADICTFNLDEWYNVKAENKTMRNFLRLRHKFMQFFLDGIAKPHYFGSETPLGQKRMLEVIRYLLDSEHNNHNYHPVDMPVPTSRSFSHKYRPGGYQKNKFQNSRKEEPNQNTSFDSRASNQYVNRNQRNNSTAQPTKTLNSDSHFTARIPPENGYLPNINTSNHQQITSSIGNSVPETQSAASSSIYHHHDQNWTSNPHSYHTNEYGYDYGSNSVYQYGGNQQLGNAQQYTSFNSSNPGSFMSSMGGYTPRGGRGRTGNCSKMFYPSERPSMNNFQSNPRSN
ncbi:hypothetical protein L5515_000674 [Caenorhabditis briggsae]|uniref:Probable ATP-dependent RNA helicase spindle-E n=2 Tax=Caenorhabditis briggsae TaxID=6238 RepID=A0AAE9E174_CAEBR|nr:hypothetical protein L5515_000674 [Caenorhabditis briggsae]